MTSKKEIEEKVKAPVTNYMIRVTNGASEINCKEQEIPFGYRRVER